MITFRYHVISIVAVFLALAVGVLLGSGPLHAEDDTVAQPQKDRKAAVARARAASLQEELRFSDAYARGTAERVVAGRLADRAVTLVTLPGADEAVTTDVAELVALAGGTVTARLLVEEELLDVANRQLVAELATQMQPETDVAVPPDGTGYERMAALLSHAVTAEDPAGAPVDAGATTVRAGLETAGLASPDGEVERRGSLVVVVSGDPYGSADERRGAGEILSALLTGLDAGSSGLVLTGPAAAAGDDGLVGAVRGDPAASKVVSTVDVADRPGGAAVAVLAMAGEATGASGHFGSPASPDGAVPPVQPTPAGATPGAGSS